MTRMLTLLIETKEGWKRESANQNYKCEMNCKLIGSLYKAEELSAGEILLSLASWLHRPPGGRGGGGIGVTAPFYPSANHHV